MTPKPYRHVITAGVGKQPPNPPPPAKTMKAMALADIDGSVLPSEFEGRCPKCGVDLDPEGRHLYATECTGVTRALDPDAVADSGTVWLGKDATAPGTDS